MHLSYIIYLLVPVGSIPELPAESCKEIKASEGQQAVSDKYWFDSLIPGKVILAHCDMEAEGETAYLIQFLSQCAHVKYFFSQQMRLRNIMFLFLLFVSNFLVLVYGFDSGKYWFRSRVSA